MKREIRRVQLYLLIANNVDEVGRLNGYIRNHCQYPRKQQLTTVKSQADQHEYRSKCCERSAQKQQNVEYHSG